MKTWRYLESGPVEPYLNMAVDEAIASAVLRGDSDPTLRFYSWEIPSVTIGCFQKIMDIDPVFCMRNSIPVVRRPTGGRAILHGDEITYSLAVRNKDHESFRNLFDSYRLLASVFFNAFTALGADVSMRHDREKGKRLIRSPHCFRSVSFGEITMKGHKIVGSAQKRYRGGFIQQGSIPFAVDRQKYREIFRGDCDALPGLAQFDLKIDKTELKKAIKYSLEQVCRVELVEGSLTEEELRTGLQLSEQKYSSPEWREFR